MRLWSCVVSHERSVMPVVEIARRGCAAAGVARMHVRAGHRAWPSAAPSVGERMYAIEGEDVVLADLPGERRHDRLVAGDDFLRGSRIESRM